jgi:hypothetical protein
VAWGAVALAKAASNPLAPTNHIRRKAREIGPFCCTGTFVQSVRALGSTRESCSLNSACRGFWSYGYSNISFILFDWSVARWRVTQKKGMLKAC